MIKLIKKVCRRSKFIRDFYFYGKSVIVMPLRFTPLSPIVNTLLPLKDVIFDFGKVFLFAKVAPYTMNSYQKLDNIYTLATEVEKKQLKGAFVECGCWKGGLAAVMGSIAKYFCSGRLTWYLDSFSGMPTPTKEDIEDTRKGIVQAKDSKLMEEGFAVASERDAREIINKLGLPEEKNIIIGGWFKDTIPKYKEKIGPIAILRLDGDWYESTKVCLNELYSQVVSGGYIVVDDYGGWLGCRKAVDEFLAGHNIKPVFKYIGGVYDPLVFKKHPPIYFQKE